jgi:hypothetical protein
MTQKIENSTDELTVQELINANEYAEARERLDDDDVVFKLAAGKAPSRHLDADNRAYVRVFHAVNHH